MSVTIRDKRRNVKVKANSLTVGTFFTWEGSLHIIVYSGGSGGTVTSVEISSGLRVRLNHQLVTTVDVVINIVG